MFILGAKNDNIQITFLITILKGGIEGNFLHVIKNIYYSV